MESVEELDLGVPGGEEVPEVPVLHLGPGGGAHEGLVTGVVGGALLPPVEAVVPVGVRPHTDPRPHPGLVLCPGLAPVALLSIEKG